MRSPQLSNLEISDICRELALLLHSGIGAADGLYLMTEEEKEPRLRGILTGMAAAMDNGSYLYATRNNSSSSNTATITLIASGKGGGNFVLRNA